MVDIARKFNIVLDALLKRLYLLFGDPAHQNLRLEKVNAFRIAQTLDQIDEAVPSLVKRQELKRENCDHLPPE